MNNLSIRNELFWDVDMKNLDATKCRRLIIERVFLYGNLGEFRAIFQYYGIETIKDEIRKVGYLDPKTFDFATSFLGLKKEEMLCYIKRQSTPTHWG